MPADQAELREIVRRAVGNKTTKLLKHINAVEHQSNRWKLKYKALRGMLDALPQCGCESPKAAPYNAAWCRTCGYQIKRRTTDGGVGR